MALLGFWASSLGPRVRGSPVRVKAWQLRVSEKVAGLISRL